MPSLEDKYAHIKKQMVFNFKIWAIFFLLTLGFPVISYLIKFDFDISSSADKIALAAWPVLFAMAMWLPNRILKVLPFNYHNDSGRMTAYRFKLYFISSLFLFANAALSIYSILAGFNKLGMALILFTLFKAWKLRPSKTEWVSFRMRYRAGRGMPVKKNKPVLA